MQKKDLLVMAIIVIAAIVWGQYAVSCYWITSYETESKIIVYTGIFVLVFLAAALARVYLLGSAPERLVKSLGQDLTGTVFRDQNYENENGNRYDLYIPAELDRMQDQNLILYIHGGSFNSGSKADGETWCRYYAAQGYITASVDYTLQMHGKMRPFIR